MPLSVKYPLLEELSPECKTHFEKLLTSESIWEKDGNYYGSVKEDPFALAPLSEVALIEWIVFNYASSLYLNKVKSRKECIDPCFIGKALYVMTPDGKPIRTSKVLAAFNQGGVLPLQIETYNTIYTVSCTSDIKYAAIAEQLRELGFLD